MLRIVMSAIALLAISATASKVDAAYCGQVDAAARFRLALARQNGVDHAYNEESCRAYGNHFFEAAKARQAASLCEDGIDRQRALDMFDAEIDAFNNLIAAHCGGS